MPAIIANNVFLRENDYDVNAQLWSDINITSDLQWYTKGAVRYSAQDSKDWRPADIGQYNYHTGERTGTLDVGSKGLDVTNSYSLYNNLYTYLKYDFGFLPDEHNLSFQVGYSQEENKYKTLTGGRENFVSNELTGIRCRRSIRSEQQWHIL